MDYTWKEIVVAALGSGGLIGGIVTLFVFITGRLDARRKRISDEKALDLSESVELKKLKVEAEEKGHTAIVNNLWKIIEEQKHELHEYKVELENCEKGNRLSTKNVNKIFEYVRQVKNEMDSLSILALSDEETNIFARKWLNIKTTIIALEKILNNEE